MSALTCGKSDFQRPRALHGQHECLGRHIVDGDVETTSMPGNPIDDFQTVRGVDHEEIKRFEPVNQHVVENASLVVGDERIPDLARFELGDVVGEQVVEKAARIGPAELDPAHVSDIEQADGLPHRLMLLDDRRVLDGHFPAGEVDHPAAVLPHARNSKPCEASSSHKGRGRAGSDRKRFNEISDARRGSGRIAFPSHWPLITRRSPHPPANMALRYSRLSRAILLIEMPAGQAASHSSVTVQAAEAFFVHLGDHRRRRAFAAPACPAATGPGATPWHSTKSMAEAFLQAATHAPQPMQAAAFIARSDSSCGTRIALASGALPVLTEM